MNSVKLNSLIVAHFEFEFVKNDFLESQKHLRLRRKTGSRKTEVVKTEVEKTEVEKWFVPCKIPLVILVPPAPPTDNTGLPVFESTAIVGAIDETIRFSGSMKLISEG